MAYNWILNKVTSVFRGVLNVSAGYGWRAISEGKLDITLAGGEFLSFDFNGVETHNGIREKALEAIEFCKKEVVKRTRGSITVSAPDRRRYTYDFKFGD